MKRVAGFEIDALLGRTFVVFGGEVLRVVGFKPAAPEGGAVILRGDSSRLRVSAFAFTRALKAGSLIEA